MLRLLAPDLRSHRFAAFLVLLTAAASTATADEPTSEPALPPPVDRTVDFTRDVRPILERHCHTCHADKRKGGLRLDRKADALAGGDSGPVIQPGNSAESELILRVTADEPTLVMPPKQERLSRTEVGVLRAWIDQGAPWPAEVAGSTATASTHWAFLKPVRPTPPAVRDASWVRNPIDQFVLARLEKEGLKPSPEADRTTLARRLALDLIGLPPDPDDIDDFLADDRPDAYERLVERLLASPHYGERWGRRWLDAARYADTNGYEKDRPRSIWPYRDWVIQAFNADMPFDQFSIEQIAGDLLDPPTLSRKTATGFHRNTMINEEGGIDVEEFRYVSLVDRVATTGAVWLGLTIGCAQCHTHKYDPITQREYYQLMAFFNNADEPEIDLPTPEIQARRQAVEARIAALESELAHRFPADPATASWFVLNPIQADAPHDSRPSIHPDGSLWLADPAARSGPVTIAVSNPLPSITALRVEPLPTAGAKKPAEPALTLRLQVAAPDHPGEPAPLPLTSTRDDQGRSLWLPEKPIRPDQAARLLITIEPGEKTSGLPTGFRLWARSSDDVGPGTTPEAVARLKQEIWERQQALHAWTMLPPSRMVSRKGATMTLLEDQSVLVSGDKPNNDVYDVELPLPERPLTALRLEVLPHPSHPRHGPGRAPLFSEGDFILTEVAAEVVTPDGSRKLALRHASEDYAEPGKPAALALDGVPESGWTIKGGVGQPHQAVFELAEPLAAPAGSKLVLTLHQFGIHQMTIGRFRLAVTSDPGPIRAASVPEEIASILRSSPGERGPESLDRLRRFYLSIAPELAAPHAELAALRASLPEFPTTMVMQERRPEHRRPTYIHQRGEFLKLGEKVEPGVPEALHPLPKDAPRDRLALARWLVSEDNPLVARVVINRIWQAEFGHGLVTTTEDFGTRGERPSHPELLDWLATEFMARGWSLKAMHRLIVTSATYRQSSHASPALLARDPNNVLLARASRFRVEAEAVRDLALAASGLLSRRIGGPSVYPPQPEGVTALAYGQSAWPVSTGPDRYRRGLYTFTKRTAPYAAFSTFDMPSSEVACVRRERSNTPLQALALLNDTVFVEAAQALARRVLSEAGPTPEERLTRAFRLCLSRSPRTEEKQAILRFHDQTLVRFRAGELDANAVAGTPVGSCSLQEQAAWTTVARALLNLDETITRE